MNSKTDKESLEAHIFSAFPILKIESCEEIRILDLLRKTAQTTGKVLVTWSIASGEDQPGSDPYKGYKTAPLQLVGESAEEEINPETALSNFAKNTEHSIIVLLDFHPYLEKARVVRLLKELAFRSERSGNKIVLLSHSVVIPDELAKLTETYDVQLPTKDQIAAIVDREVALFSIRRKNATLTIDEHAKSMLINNLVGVSLSDAERLIKNAIYIDGAISGSDIPEIKKAKYRLISKAGALTFEYDTASFNEMGGFSYLKTWINNRKNDIVDANSNKESIRDRPKGILLLGVQGCGKSLAARAISGQLGIPLIRLDFGALFDKYIGESERNIREALHSAKVMSPCVLWIDEIEKAISGKDDNTGASSRVLGTLLSWMQENKSGTFLVATANDITALPPELIRKGRLDEIFFVDLPTAPVRRAILQSVLDKRKFVSDNFDLTQLADSCAGFSGAEIEQAVVSAIYSAPGDVRELNTQDIISEMHLTRPLSVVRHEEIASLREWASARTVNVDGDHFGQDQAVGQ